MTVFHVAGCPLVICSWKSDPLISEQQTIEAVRSHLMRSHSQADLVDNTIVGVRAERYQREGEKA